MMQRYTLRLAAEHLSVLRRYYPSLYRAATTGGHIYLVCTRSVLERITLHLKKMGRPVYYLADPISDDYAMSLLHDR